nr:hypothetical protein CFP56_06022 [Quercus suber]
MSSEIASSGYAVKNRFDWRKNNSDSGCAQLRSASKGRSWSLRRIEVMLDHNVWVKPMRWWLRQGAGRTGWRLARNMSM